MTSIRVPAAASVFVVVLACSIGCKFDTAKRKAWYSALLPSRSAAQAGVEIGQMDAVSEQHKDPQQQKNALLFARGNLLESEQKPAEAVEVYRTILKSDPRNVPALHRLAIIHAEQGEIKAAEQAFRSALAEMDDNARLHNDFGYFCYLLDRPDEAERHLTRAIELDASLLEAHNNLGLVRARMGRWESAEQQFQLAGCRPAESINNIAFARLREDDYDGAKAAYQRALSEEPRLACARKGLDVVSRF